MRHEGMPALDVSTLVVAFFGFIGNLGAASGFVWVMMQMQGVKGFLHLTAATNQITMDCKDARIKR